KVSDISPTSPTSFGSEMVEFNGQLYYGTTNALMKSDGTAAGTTVVKSGISPGFLTVMNVGGNPRILFSSIHTAPTVSELWISDGTDPGTFMLKNNDPAELTVVNLQ